MIEQRFAVAISGVRAGTIHYRDDYSWFELDEEYRGNPNRPILGMIFETDPGEIHSSSLKLPPWFSNLLPEGILRDWIAADRNVSRQREMELLAQVGHDLPGAVTVLTEGGATEELAPGIGEPEEFDSTLSPRLKFSLAGVGIKLSMVLRGDRLSLPASGETGEYIVKFPEPKFEGVTRNEFAMMSMAKMIGIDVPDIYLEHRDNLPGTPDVVWQGKEEIAYVIRRFDRDPRVGRVHIEDFAQVRNFPPVAKYQGGFETVAALAYRRGEDSAALDEVVRRLAFNILVSNGDAHLKNWSLIYLDPQAPTLSPAYDIVSTAPYPVDQDDLGLRFAGTRRISSMRLNNFVRLGERLEADGERLAAIAEQVIDSVLEAWPKVEVELADHPEIRAAIGATISRNALSLKS